MFCGIKSIVFKTKITSHGGIKTSKPLQKPQMQNQKYNHRHHHQQEIYLELLENQSTLMIDLSVCL